jgi:hypothetical protein
MELLCLSTGVISMSIGLTFFWIVRLAIRIAESDPKARSSATWKKVGFQTTIWAIEEFIRSRKLTYAKKIDDWPLSSLYNNPEYEYLLNGDVSITSLYSEGGDGRVDGRVYRWLHFGYDTSNYLYARKLQRELDKFLTRRDLIRRVA